MMSKMIDVKSTAEFLLDNDNYLILMHANPDGDTIGGGFALHFALRRLGKKSRVLCADEFSKKFDYIIKNYSDDEQFDIATVVAVDVADEKLLGELQGVYGGKIKLCIDHHRTNKMYAEMTYVNSNSAAVCECIYEILQQMGVLIDSLIANCLYTGLATDTGCFKFSNTTPKTHIYAAELMTLGAEYGEINRIHFEVKSQGRLKIEKEVLKNIEFYFEGKCAVITVTQSMINQTGCDMGDIDGITAMSRQIEGVFVGVTIREKPNGNFKVSIRTFDPYNAAEICSVFGGGGHTNAAGCEFSCTLEETKQSVLSEVNRVIEQQVSK